MHRLGADRAGGAGGEPVRAGRTRGMMIMRRIPGKSVAALAAAAGAGLLAAACGSSGPASGTQTFDLTTHSVTGNPVYHAVASGVFSATGTMQAASSATNAPLVARFPGGTFDLGNLTAGKESASVNPTTCGAVFNVTGVTYRLSNGTGSYKGISGHGSATLKFTGTLPKLSNGKCNESSTAQPVPGSTTTTVHASGPATVP
jgi:hypothetical protein